MSYKVEFLSLGLVFLLSLSEVSVGQMKLTGMQFKSQLSAPIAGMTYNEAISGEALPRFADTQSLYFYLDRRCASDSLFSLDAYHISVRQFYDQVGGTLNWGVSYPDGLIYMGPKNYTAALRTLLQSQLDAARKLPQESMTKWVKRKPLKWEEGTNPKQLLESIAQETGFQIYGLDKMPHDIWGAGAWPAMSVAQQVQLIVGQFDLTYKFDSTGTKIALVPLDLSKVAVVRSYPDGGKAQQRIDAFKKDLPECQFVAKGGKIYVRGRMEDVERILSNGIVRPAVSTPDKPQTAENKPENNTPAVTAPLENQRLTLPKVSVPPVILARAIAKKLGLTVEVDENELRNAGIALEKVIEFEIKDVTVDQFFQQLGDKSGCTMTRVGTAVIIRPKSR